MSGLAASGGARTGYIAAMIGGGVLVLIALALSYLIPDPERMNDK